MINTLHLRNFKCFEDEIIHLSNLNLLTGLNGMGKSSVIQSLLLLRQNFENGLLTTQRRLGLNGDYVNIGNTYDLLYRYFQEKEIAISLNAQGDLSPAWRWSAEENNDALSESWNGGVDRLSKLSLFNTKFHYLNAERIGPRPYYETSSFKVVHQNQLGVRGEFAANYFSVNKSNIIPIEGLKFTSSVTGTNNSQNEIGLTLYEQVNAWLGIIRPGAQVRITDQPDAGTNTLSFEFLVSKDNPGPYRSQNVGFGLTYVFPLLVSILASEPGTLLLIENPEAHIHPKGQAELGVLIALAAANGIQLIVETHSDHILNGIRYAAKQELINKDLIRLMFFTGVVSENKFRHYIEYIQVLERGKLSHRPTDFFDVWDEMLTRLI
jgi:predicted ATPase